MTLKIVKWEVSPIESKKYRVHLSNGKHVDFGSSKHQQYKDITPLRAFSHLDHLDKKRRDLYYARHNVNYPRNSADWLSKHYLWPKHKTEDSWPYLGENLT